MNRFANMIFGLAAALTGSQAAANSVDLTFERDLVVGDRSVPYVIDLKLSETAATRIGIETRLDLREAQSELGNAMRGYVLADLCILRAEIQQFDVTAEDELFRFDGSVAARLYRCAREGLKATERGELLLSETAAVTVQAAVVVQDNCVTFRVADLKFALESAVEPTQEQKDGIELADSLLRTVIGGLMANHPICPSLPPELASLSPHYGSGGTTEIGDGGAGVTLNGSVDVSTGTILDILQTLQNRGVLPSKP
ncbi:MAG: hypothetical protein ABJH07_25160 [Sedimentitalea sp.]|uniref:hypothetical protein n=1 Tax=Sedimentitalea sp. TaxID=2048915 RepID=UPI003262F363